MKPEKKFYKQITPYLFILPAFVFILIFFYSSILIAFFNSFQNNTLGFKTSFAGVANYVKIFSDKIFLSSFKNQAIYTIAGIFNNLFFPFLAAELIYLIRRKTVSEFVKKIFVFPMFVPGIVTILTWKYLYGNNLGINSILNVLGLDMLRHDWLNDGATAIWSIVFVGFPFISGLYFLIMHAAINTIPSDLCEAGILDGCTTINLIRYIHIPHIIPYVNMMLMLIIIGSLQNYGMVMATTSGGPGYSSMIPSLYMYLVAFYNNDLGYGSALGIFIMLVIIVLTQLVRKVVRR